MSRLAKNIVGQKFGRLTAVKRVENAPKSGDARWFCKCDCGGSNTLTFAILNKGLVKSCGCLARELTSLRSRTHGESVHQFRTTEYKAWIGMIQRIEESSAPGFKYYGGKGIVICARWRQNYSAFLEDMGRKPSPKHTLDRINPDGNYEPGNCRWATQLVQQNNRTNNVFLEFNGVRKTISEWARQIGMNKSSLTRRIKRGLSIETALFSPVNPGRHRT